MVPFCICDVLLLPMHILNSSDTVQPYIYDTKSFRLLLFCKHAIFCLYFCHSFRRLAHERTDAHTRYNIAIFVCIYLKAFLLTTTRHFFDYLFVLIGFMCSFDLKLLTCWENCPQTIWKKKSRTTWVGRWCKLSWILFQFICE